MWQFVAARRREAERALEPLLSCSRPVRRQQLANARNDLTEYAAKQLLADYGIPVTAEALSNSADEAVQQATAIGFPVALKVVSSDIAHKTEAGGVRIGLRDAHAVRQAYEEILRNAQQHAPHATIDGVLVQAMVSGGVEVILGVTNDPLFGLAIMFGLGGIYAEVLRDVSFRILPITRSEAEAMVREIRTFPLLDGARGQPKADVHALVDTILALAALAQDLGEHISGIDINPLFVKPAGQGVVAADALIQLQR
jgi:acyl-CoA synthetase (NDP forming)